MAYISTAEVKEVRNALKEEFGKDFKFSVTKRDGGLAVSVAIVASKLDFSEMWEGKAETDYGYGYQSINQYHITPENCGQHVKVFERIVEIIKTAPAKAEGGEAWFDKSDSQTDYFHTAFYFDVAVGKWDKPYVQTH